MTEENMSRERVILEAVCVVCFTAVCIAALCLHVGDATLTMAIISAATTVIGWGIGKAGALKEIERLQSPCPDCPKRLLEDKTSDPLVQRQELGPDRDTTGQVKLNLFSPKTNKENQ